MTNNTVEVIKPNVDSGISVSIDSMISENNSNLNELKSNGKTLKIVIGFSDAYSDGTSVTGSYNYYYSK